MSYSVVKANLTQHKQDIVAVWERNYPGVILKKFEWMYLNNPAGVAHVWLLKHEESDQFIGVTAVFPRIFVVDKVRVNAGIAGDFLIDQGHRSLGPALILQRAVLTYVDNGTFDLVYGFPNEKSEVIFKKVGYAQLGSIVRAVKVLRSKSVLMKKMPSFPALLSSYFIDMWLYLCFVIKAIKVSYLKQFYSVEYDKFIDGKLLLSKNSEKIASPLKNSVYLNWKYKLDQIDMKSTVSLVNNKTKSIEDISIFTYDNKTVEMNEICFFSEFKNNELALFSLENIFRKKNIEKIIFSYVDNKLIYSKLKKLGFSFRNTGSSAYVYMNKSFKVAYQFLSSKDHWMIVRSDDDM